MKVRLQHVISNINLPTVIKTAILFNESVERLFVATQIGEIFYIKNGIAETFLDIRSQVISKRVGHSSSATTRDIYSHVFETSEKEAVGKLDTILN